ncbi:putative HTLV-1-related endogenous sequence [Capricornis sumatraensis]|uniref:putative HTLV-1-related endogenous sequence n=1 Tax=Capricornis sumatraensis TaxID=34865 RepID=UPI003604821C
MQRTKKKVQQSKPNHLVVRRLPSQAAPPGTTPPPVARARPGSSPRVRAIRVPGPAPRTRRPAGARSPHEASGARRREPAPRPRAPRAPAVAGGGWRYRKGSRLPSPAASLPGGKASPGRRNKGAARRGRRTEVPGEGGRRGGARRRRESILQPFPPRKRAVPAAGELAAARLPAASPPPTPEVRDKYAPAGLSWGSGVGTCPGWAGTCVRGGWRRAQSELWSPRRAAGPGYRRWGEWRAGGRPGPGQRGRAAGNLLRYQALLASPPAPRGRLQKKTRP